MNKKMNLLFVLVSAALTLLMMLLPDAAPLAMQTPSARTRARSNCR